MESNCLNWKGLLIITPIHPPSSDRGDRSTTGLGWLVGPQPSEARALSRSMRWPEHIFFFFQWAAERALSHAPHRSGKTGRFFFGGRRGPWNPDLTRGRLSSERKAGVSAWLFTTEHSKEGGRRDRDTDRRDFSEGRRHREIDCRYLSGVG